MDLYGVNRKVQYVEQALGWHTSVYIDIIQHLNCMVWFNDYEKHDLMYDYDYLLKRDFEHWEKNISQATVSQATPLLLMRQIYVPHGPCV